MSLLLSLFAAQVAFAAEPLQLEDGEQPDHLTPVSPLPLAYQRLIDEKLLVTSGNFGRMILFPSFEGEMALSAFGSKYTKEIPQKPQAFYITVTKADGSLYFSLPENNEGKRRKPVSIKRTEVQIDREFAVAIQRAWATMLLSTRYPRRASAGLDGYTAQFSVFVRGAGVLQGKTWSPKQGLLKEFVEMGRELIHYCSLSEKERLAQREGILKRLEILAEKARNVSKD